MHGNPLDMFDEMDEMFARLFSRMDREFMSAPQVHGYRIMIRDEGQGPVMPEMAEDDALVSRMNNETVAEVHHVGDEVKVIADLPGITEEALRLDVKRNRLVIDAGDADNHYHTITALPPVDTASMQKTLKNGILEVTFTSRPAQSGQS